MINELLKLSEELNKILGKSKQDLEESKKKLNPEQLKIVEDFEVAAKGKNITEILELQKKFINDIRK